MITSPMNTYDEMVKDLIKNDSSVVFNNISADHAKFIIKSFVDEAKQSIEILSGSFCKAFYSNIDFYNCLESAAKRINSTEKIKIITLNNTDYAAIKEKLALINKTIGLDVITYVPCQYLGKEPIKHFMVVDNKRYREEEPHEEFEQENMPQNVKASVCCNGVKKANELSSKFNSIWDALKVKTPIHA